MINQLEKLKKKKKKKKKGDNDNGDREQLINDKKIEIIR
jgi:hypothetical protein